MAKLLPPIRNVEAYPVKDESESMFVLHDPSGYAKEDVTVSKFVLFVLQHMDGKTSYEQLQDDFNKTLGQEFEIDEIENLIEDLDQHYLVDSDRFQDYKDEVDREFLDASARCYSCFSPLEEPEDVRKVLDKSFISAGYPIGPDIEPVNDNITGIIAPHIDYYRGRGVYGFSYGELLKGFAGDTIIIIGTNHQSGQSAVTGTEKDFETLFGTVQTDKEAVHALADEIEGDLFLDEIDHRNEHSIELAATVLAYAGRHETTRIVPILVKGIERLIIKGKSPMNDETISTTVEAIRSFCNARPGKVAVIASADLAHVGQQFGDAHTLDEQRLNKVEKRDRMSLDFVCMGDANGFFRHVMSDFNKNNVCGLSPIYMALSILQPMAGNLLKYEQWVHEQNYGSVSFAAVSFKKRTPVSD